MVPRRTDRTGIHQSVDMAVLRGIVSSGGGRAARAGAGSSHDDDSPDDGPDDSPDDHPGTPPRAPVNASSTSSSAW